MTGSDRPRLAHLGVAFMLLTRLPVHLLGFRIPAEAFAGAVWAYPVVGAAVGAVGGVALRLAIDLGFPVGFSSVFAIAAMVLVTGAIHEDGFADTADGIGGGKTRERALEIMRDSRIGTYGAVALVLVIAARIAALAAIADPGQAGASLVVAAALGRSAILVLVLLLSPARSDGLASGLRATARRYALLGLFLAVAIAFGILPGGMAFRAVLAVAIVSVGVALLAQTKVGGYTGDILGASSVLTETFVLAIAASV